MGDARGAIPFVERLLSLGLAPEAERQWRLRLGQLQEQSQDLRQAALNLRRAWDQPPTNLVALRELARFLERARDDRGRRLLWEEAQERLTADALDPGPAVSVGEAWLGLREVATQRQRGLAARFAGQMADGTAPFDGRGVVARLLRDPEAEDRLYRALAPAVSSGLRALLRAVAPHLAHERKLDLRARGLLREERAGKGELREVVMASAHEASLADLEIYVKAEVRASFSVPGSPPALVLSRAIAHLGAPGLRFVAARESYLLASGNAFLLADDPAQAGLFLAGLVRVFVPSFVHPSFPEELIEQRAEQLGRSLPKKKKSDLAPFGWEAAGPFDIQALRDGLRAVADVVGLLGCGHLPSALASIVAERAQMPGASLGQVPDARALVAFALSADLDDLWRAWS